MKPDSAGGDQSVPRFFAAAIERYGDNRAALFQFLSDCDKIAAHRKPMMIVGEPGVGKSELAAFLHRRAEKTAKGALVPINLATVPKGLAESMLFGHVEGSFTGATREQTGLIELADGGTVLLDELHFAPRYVQAKLLDCVQHGRVRRTGADKDTAVDVFFIGASSRPSSVLPELRERLGFVKWRLRPLRERPEQIKLLARTLLDDAYVRNRYERRVLSEDSLKWLESLPWAGNVRELKHLMERVVVLPRASGAEIETEELRQIRGETTLAAPADLAGQIETLVARARIEELGDLNRLIDAVYRGGWAHADRLADKKNRAKGVLGISWETLRKYGPDSRRPDPRNRPPGKISAGKADNSPDPADSRS